MGIFSVYFVIVITVTTAAVTIFVFVGSLYYYLLTNVLLLKMERVVIVWHFVSFFPFMHIHFSSVFLAILVIKAKQA